MTCPRIYSDSTLSPLSSVSALLSNGYSRVLLSLRTRPISMLSLIWLYLPHSFSCIGLHFLLVVPLTSLTCFVSLSRSSCSCSSRSGPTDFHPCLPSRLFCRLPFCPPSYLWLFLRIIFLSCCPTPLNSPFWAPPCLLSPRSFHPCCFFPPWSPWLSLSCLFAVLYLVAVTSFHSLLASLRPSLPPCCCLYIRFVVCVPPIICSSSLRL